MMNNFLEPYNPDWKKEFENIRQVIEMELKELIPVIDIQHVGSTSVEGLVAKPILDIDIVVGNKELINEITARLEKIGYKSKGEQGIPGRFAFRQISGSTPLTAAKRIWQLHHLYVCYTDSLALKNHILFRDKLRDDKDLLKSYAKLKKHLADNATISRVEYAKMKTDFIIAVLATTTEFGEQELESIKCANT